MMDVHYSVRKQAASPQHMIVASLPSMASIVGRMRHPGDRYPLLGDCRNDLGIRFHKRVAQWIGMPAWRGWRRPRGATNQSPTWGRCRLHYKL